MQKQKRHSPPFRPRQGILVNNTQLGPAPALQEMHACLSPVSAAPIPSTHLQSCTCKLVVTGSLGPPTVKGLREGHALAVCLSACVPTDHTFMHSMFVGLGLTHAWAACM